MYSLNIKFQEKIFTNKKVIKLWNFGNFGLSKIIPKSLVTLRFSKVSLHELKGICKCFQMRYWPNFYVDPTYSNTCFFKVGKRRVLLQGTVSPKRVRIHSGTPRRKILNDYLQRFNNISSFIKFVIEKFVNSLSCGL